MPYAPQITPAGLEDLLQHLVLTDPRVNTFRLGDFAELETKSDLYPAILYELVSSKLKLNKPNLVYSTVYTVRLYCFTQRLESDQNVVSSFSLTQTILTDLVVRMTEDQRLQDMGVFFDGDASFDYVLRDGRADVVGTSAEVRISTPVVLCPDALPQ